MDALSAAGIAFHLAKHENAASFMAEGSYHVTGAPGILLATLGPGVANAVNVVANAAQDRVPLISLTGRVDAAEAAGYTHQVVELLLPIRHRTDRLGGSHARRDLIAWTLLEAALRAKRYKLALRWPTNAPR